MRLLRSCPRARDSIGWRRATCSPTAYEISQRVQPTTSSSPSNRKRCKRPASDGSSSGI